MIKLLVATDVEGFYVFIQVSRGGVSIFLEGGNFSREGGNF